MPNRLAGVLAPVAVLLHAAAAFAGIAPENVAVVVNGDSWASLAVANEYAKVRHIPPSNFIVLHGLSSFDQTDVNQFRTEVLSPVFAAIESRGLTPQIDCIAYSVDLPYSVNVSADMAGKPFQQVITRTASANGLTYLHEWVQKKDTDYLRLDINRYTRRTLPLSAAAPLTQAEQADYQRGMTLYDSKQYEQAAAVLESLTRVKRGDPSMFYNLACCQALAGKPDDAMDTLRAAAEIGWRNHGQTTSDPDLKSLAGRPDFKKLIDEMKSASIQVQPTRGFRSRYAWNDAGEPGDSGPHYMLSTMLGVTSGRGNSVNEVLGSLRRSAAADGDSPRGTIYFMKNGDVRSATRDWAFPSAMAELNRLGVNTVTQDGVLPKDRSDVAGAIIGIANFDWPASKSTILPGAICEHLTSLGGIISERAGQTPCTEFIRAGAAGTSGTVTEPYALQEKFPTAFMHLHYARGCTLAEAFYQSLYGPYQLLIIGDPLCRPWGRELHISIPGLTPGAPVKGTIKLQPAAAAGGQSPVESFEVYVDGTLKSEAPPGSPQSIDTTLLPDGHHTISVIAVQKEPLQGRSRQSVPIVVRNHDRQLVASRKPPARIGFGQPLTLWLSCPGAARIEVEHLGRPVGSCDGPTGSIEVDSSLLGPGPAVLFPVAKGVEAGAIAAVRGAPIEVLVTPPDQIAPRPPRSGQKLNKGLSLTLAGGPSITIDDTLNGDWLSKAGARAGQEFELTGYFEVPEADLYQVQLKSANAVKVEISGIEVTATAGKNWRYAPASLRPGMHTLTLTGAVPADGKVNIRLGAPGAYCPSAERFRH